MTIIRLFCMILVCLPLHFAQGQAKPKTAKHPKAQDSSHLLPLPGDEPMPVKLKAEAFLGTWEWRSATEVFRMTITRDQYHRLPNGETMHVLLGKHSFSRNGVVIESSYAYNSYTKDWSLNGRPYAEREIVMGFLDITKRKIGRATLNINYTTPNQLQFQLREIEYVRINQPGTPPPPTPGFTIPMSMTLTRVQ